MGADFSSGLQAGSIILGGLIPLGLALWLGGTGFVAIGLGLLVTALILFVAKKNLGGITGDVLGMIIELVEVSRVAGVFIRRMMSNHTFPFRLGTTSYIIPDDILPNARYLADKVRDIELVLFEVDDGMNNLPSPQVIKELAELARQYDMTYTIHLPLDLKLGDDGSDKRYIPHQSEARHRLYERA